MVQFGQAEKALGLCRRPLAEAQLELFDSPEPGQGALQLTAQFSEIQVQVTLTTIFSDFVFFFGPPEQCLAHLPVNTLYLL